MDSLVCLPYDALNIFDKVWQKNCNKLEHSSKIVFNMNALDSLFCQPYDALNYFDKVRQKIFYNKLEYSSKSLFNMNVLDSLVCLPLWDTYNIIDKVI